MYVKDSNDIRVYFDWMLFSAYSIVTFSFLPIFVLIMTLFKVTSPEVYNRIKVRVSLVFFVFITFLVIRLYLYADIKNLHMFFKEPSIYATIPFYITEIIIAVSLSYVLHISSQVDSKQSQEAGGSEGGDLTYEDRLEQIQRQRKFTGQFNRVDVNASNGDLASGYNGSIVMAGAGGNENINRSTSVTNDPSVIMNESSASLLVPGNAGFKAKLRGTTTVLKKDASKLNLSGNTSMSNIERMEGNSGYNPHLS